MRLLFVVHQFLPEFSAGTEIVTLHLAKAAQRDGHRADILTCSLDPAAGWRGPGPEGFLQASAQGLAVAGIPAALIPDPYGFADGGARNGLPQSLDRFLDRGGYDLVHVMHSMRMLEVVARVRAAGLPYMVTLTDFLLLCYRINLVRLDGTVCVGPDGGRNCAAHCRCGEVDRAAIARRQEVAAAVLRGAAMRVACSDFVARAFRREHPGLPVRVVNHGIDLLSMRPRANAADRETTVFGYVGTISRAKGVDLLLRAFSAAAAPRARLTLVGTLTGDAAFVAEVSERVAADPRIRLRGPVPASLVPAALAGFDALCLPSRLPETFSLALHEGFAAGLPALVGDLGHPAGVVREAGCGMVIPVGDVAAWTEAIAMVAADPALLEGWRPRLPLPLRIEEEAFLYSQLYKACIA